MKELLSDNMALQSQLEELPAQTALAARPHHLREIESPLSWAFCFLMYIAVRTGDKETRDMLAYARLVIQEAQCRGRTGWFEYDKWFRRQQAALSTPQPWNELMVPVHPVDHCLLGVRWGEDVFVVPFGLRSAPNIFFAVSDCLAWILQARGVTHQLHYLDDFLLVGPPDTSACAQALQFTLDTCQELGLPVSSHKTEGPSCQLTLLAIQIDTTRMELSLPSDKLACISATVCEWRGRKAATKSSATVPHTGLNNKIFLRVLVGGRIWKSGGL